MELRQLRYLRAVADAGTYSRAARELGLTQPALGQQIRRLEVELGADLVRRHSRGVDLTETGRLLAASAGRVLDELDATVARVRAQPGGLEGSVRLGMTLATSLILSGPLVRRVAAETPAIRLGIVTEMSSVVVDWLAAGQLDLALAYNVVDMPGIRWEPVLEDALLFVQSPRQAAPAPGREIAFADVAAARLIVPGQPHTVRRRLEETARQLGLTLDIAFEVQSAETVRQLAIEGIGAAVLPYGIVRKEIESGLLRPWRIVDPPIRRTLYFVYSSRRPLTFVESTVKKLLESVIRDELARDNGCWLPLTKGKAVRRAGQPGKRASRR